jgi:predicted alpha/beta-hydrolase family hydrolase
MKLSTKRIKLLPHEDAALKVDSILLRPDKPVALLVLGHGAGAGMTHANMESIALAMAAQGIATYRYNFPFMQRGGGRDKAQVTTDTIRSAVAKARKLIPNVPLLAGGHSFGGRMTTVAQAESPLENVEGLVCCAFPLHAPGKASNHRVEHFSDIKVPCLFHCGDRDAMMTFDLFEPVTRKMKANRKSLATLHKIYTAGHGYKIAKRTRTSDESVFDEMARVTRDWIGGALLRSPRKKSRARQVRNVSQSREPHSLSRTV